ncbi:MAG: response regulator [Proteobacteria bacterium]|nr:MAG: response regulator [Pseudomonadota bacterium]
MDLSVPLGSVLIVETDQGMQSLICTYLKKLGARPTIVEKWDADAERLVKSGQFDLAVIDWKTRLHPAFEIYKSIRAQSASAKTPVIFISGQVTRDDIIQTSTDPLTKFCVKPFTEELLLKAVSDLLRKKIELKKPKASNITIHKGNKPTGLAPAQIIRNEALERGGLDLFEGTHAEALAMAEGVANPLAKAIGSVETSGALAASDIDLSEESESIGVTEDSKNLDSKSLSYAKKMREGSSSFDYRLLAKTSHSTTKVRTEIPIDVLVIDDDKMLTNLVQNHLSATKTDLVEVAANANDGWAAILRYNFQLIVMDWRCKGINGLALYNRIRARPETRKIPVIILISGIERDNFKIIEDKKCTFILEKPFDLQTFERAVNSVRSFEDKDYFAMKEAVEAVDSGEGDKRRVLSAVIAKAKKVSHKFDFLLACGQYLIHQEEYVLAHKVLEGASKIEPENVTLMTELAKVYLRLNRPTDSLKLLDLANQFSPGNIQRLCLMGEVGLDLFDTEKARKYFDEALVIDQENETAKQGATLATNLSDFAQSHGYKPLKDQFASTLNLIGITLIKNGQIEKGIEQYHCAMAFIRDGLTLGRLQFNLGLAYYRLDNRNQALEWLEEAIRSVDGDYPKAVQWATRIRAEISRANNPKKDSTTINWGSDEVLESLADSLQKFMEDESA